MILPVCAISQIWYCKCVSSHEYIASVCRLTNMILQVCVVSQIWYCKRVVSQIWYCKCKCVSSHKYDIASVCRLTNMILQVCVVSQMSLFSQVKDKVTTIGKSVSAVDSSKEDHGQSKAEDKDMYSTRGWITGNFLMKLIFIFGHDWMNTIIFNI